MLVDVAIVLTLAILDSTRIDRSNANADDKLIRQLMSVIVLMHSEAHKCCSVVAVLLAEVSMWSMQRYVDALDRLLEAFHFAANCARIANQTVLRLQVCSLTDPQN